MIHMYFDARKVKADIERTLEMGQTLLQKMVYCQVRYDLLEENASLTERSLGRCRNTR